MQFEEATKEKGVVITSSPLLIPKAFIIKCNALVPEFTATAYFTPTKNATKFSNSFSLGPNANFGLCNTFTTALISNWVISCFERVILYIKYK